MKTSKEIKNTKEVRETNPKVSLLREFMIDEKPYLNPSLTIRSLSEEIKMNSRGLSVLINQQLNQHFFGFINEYRVKEAMRILKKPIKKGVHRFRNFIRSWV